LSVRPGTAAVVAVAAAVGALAGLWTGEFADLSVYRYGGDAVLDLSSPYDARDPATGYPFTYPPAAAVLMAPLALVPGTATAALWTAASAACLAAAVVLLGRTSGWSSPWMLASVVVGAIALEPVWQNFAFGQINTLVMLAVLADMLRPERRTAGVLLGLAAAVKLTPLIFVVLLVMVG
jgi:alpha-1,2-mannosyltransferase